MNWLRRYLHYWIVPEANTVEELAVLRKMVKRLEKVIAAMMLYEQKIKGRVNEEIMSSFNHIYEEALEKFHGEVNTALSFTKESADKILQETMDELHGEANSLFFRFPGKKNVAVKNVLRLLLNRQRLTVHLVKDGEGDRHPVIRKKRLSGGEVI